MRLRLIAGAMFLGYMASATAPVEARPAYGYGDRYERHHADRRAQRSAYRHREQRGYRESRYGYRQASARRGYRGYSQRGYGYRGGYASRYAGRGYASGRHYAQRRYGSGRRYASAGRGGRPSAWCGWWMRTQLGGGPEYNLAANWRRYGRASGPHVGAVVVWPHHVGMITGRSANGQWIVKSGNDGGAVRERARSVAGAVFRAG
jgi:hypothetical protein